MDAEPVAATPATPVSEPAPGPVAEPLEPAGSAEPAGAWATRWEQWSQGQYLMTGIVLCALSLIGHAIPVGGADAARTVVCLVIGIAGAAIIVVPWIGKLRIRPRSGGTAGGADAPARRRPVDERLRASPYPKALWVYSAWITLLSSAAVLAFLALAVGRHAPGFVLGVVLFGIPAILFGSLVWTTRDIWSRSRA